MLQWYADCARDLPWRRPDTSAWAVLVSEVMLQQTPVSRVLPVYADWLARWPVPAALAAAPRGEAVRQWGSLGYPRRALRLWETARLLVDRHGGHLPTSYDALVALPGVGAYTAAAVASFAFGQRRAVLDTNVRRVLARVVAGQAQPAGTVTAAERRRAEALLPDTDQAPGWAVAVMELGALVCTARSPRCGDCPITGACAWHRNGRPPAASRARPAQGYLGTDRQARGALLATLRAVSGPVTREQVEAAWPDPGQRDRALHGLADDRLVELLPGGAVGLPG